MVTKSSQRATPAASARRARQAARLAEQQRSRRRWTVAAVVLAAVAVLVAVAAVSFGNTGKGVAQGFRAERAAFDLPALEGGGHVRLADHAGRPVVVNFFASWCVYCNEELPGFVQVAQATRGRVDFIGVNTSETGDGAAMARRFDLAGAGFALARDIGPEPASQLWSSFGGQGLPVTAFYDANGKLVDFSGGMLSQPELESRIGKNYGVDVHAPDASTLAAPVIPLIPRGAFELMRNHQGDPAWVTLDVRTPAEFAAGHLQDATNVDLQDPAFRDRLSRLDKDKSFFVYCQTGHRSAEATTVMHEMGFKHVYDIQGGLTAWQQAGLPLAGG